MTALPGDARSRDPMADRRPHKPLPIARLAVIGAVALLVGLVTLQLLGWRHALAIATDTFHAGMRLITTAGPTLFFVAMAVLPALGAPTSAFSLTAGPAFGADLGTPAVVLLGVAAIVVNLTFTYWLARRWVRPLVARIVTRFGYAIPTVQGDDVTELIVILRVTPGVPFFAQNYLLGLADVPFGRYLAISCLIQVPMNAAFILFGGALASGRGAVALTALLAVIALGFAVHLVRKHLAKPVRR